MISSIGSGGYSPMTLSGMGGGNGFPDPARMQEKLFAKADANGDGAIDKTELSSLRENAPAGGGKGRAGNAGDLFEGMDADADGRITQQEATDAAGKLLDGLRAQFMQSGMGGMQPSMGGNASALNEELFSRIDIDGDGNITKEESQAAMESRRGERRGPSQAATGEAPATGNADINALIASLLQQYQSANQFASADPESLVSLFA